MMSSTRSAFSAETDFPPNEIWRVLTAEYIRVKIPDSIFIDYTIRSKHGELSESHNEYWDRRFQRFLMSAFGSMIIERRQRTWSIKLAMENLFMKLDGNEIQWIPLYWATSVREYFGPIKRPSRLSEVRLIHQYSTFVFGKVARLGI